MHNCIPLTHSIGWFWQVPIPFTHWKNAWPYLTYNPTGHGSKLRLLAAKTSRSSWASADKARRRRGRRVKGMSFMVLICWLFLDRFGPNAKNWFSQGSSGKCLFVCVHLFVIVRPLTVGVLDREHQIDEGKAQVMDFVGVAHLLPSSVGVARKTTRGGHC